MTTLTPSQADTRRSRPHTATPRYWEVDALRGVAILMMVTYHLMWDFWAYQIIPNLNIFQGFWKYFQRTTAGLFLTLVGVSLAIVTLRRLGNHLGNPVNPTEVDANQLPPFRPYLWRGLRIFGWGMVVTLIVWASGIGYVHFGILHLIGFASIAAYPLLRRRWLNLALWALFNLVGYFLLPLRVDFPWLLWLGLVPRNYYPNDYFPVIPYFGVVLLGLFIGNSLYTSDGRRFSLPDLSAWLPIRGLQWLGQHTLVIYLLHQPLLYVILAALGLIQL